MVKSYLKPQEEYKIRIDNSNQPFKHVRLEKSEDGSRLIHPLVKHSVNDFIGDFKKKVGVAEPVKPSPVESTPLKLVQNLKDIKELTTKLGDVNEFSVDLKQIQDRSFQGLTCLMQISTRTEDFIVDTLKLRPIVGPYLREVFKDPTKRKVMHGADQCILWLQRDFGIYVCNMFDTAQASKVLKFEENSLEFLMRHFCEVAANNEYKHVDCRLRPLTCERMRYVSEGTHFLLSIYDHMQRSLLVSSTDPDCPEGPLIEVYQRSYDICMKLYQKEILTENSYLNIDGLHAADLNAQQLAIAAGLYDWRDATARKNDESTGFILPNKVLIEIAKQTHGELENLLKSRNAVAFEHVNRSHAADISGQQLAIPAGLGDQRDATARKNDESTGFILPKKVVTKIAKQIPGELRNLLKSRHPFTDGDLDSVVSIIIENSMQNAVAFEHVARKLKEEHIELMASRNAKMPNGEEATEVAGSKSNAVEGYSFEKEAGNFIVGANQNLTLDCSSASGVSIEVQEKPSRVLGPIFGNAAETRKATKEIKAEQIKSSVCLPLQSFTDKTKPGHESDGAIASEKEARSLFPNHHEVKILVGDRNIIVETGEIAKQASGSVILKDGGTTIYTTVCKSDSLSEPSDLFPMFVHYQEHLSAAGKTSGGYHKREGRLKDHEVLVCRQVDRALRPTMRKGFCHETHIVSKVLCYDGLHSPDSLAVIAAGVAVALSEVPNTSTVAGVRIGLIGDKFVVNPTTMEMKESKLDLLLAGSEAGIITIEGACDFLPEEKLLQAMGVGMDAVKAICKEVDNLVKVCGKHKMLDSIKLPPPELYKCVEEIAGDELVRALQMEDKIPRSKTLSSLESKVLSKLTKVEEFDQGNVHIKPDPTLHSKVDVKLVFKSVCSKYLRKQIVEGGKRSDGRTSKEIRSIASKCGQLSQTHGSALFTRGETQAMAVVTLGDKQMAQRIENLDVEDTKRFYLQYSFPQSCVGGVGKIGAPSRREIGHGTLAERALKPILPSEDDFPYTIRVECTITESDGSSSMASVCGGCLALQDAGVPLKSTIAGIAMGMVLDTKEFGGDGTPLILSDITGSEDASGDMDLKVAGNDDGVTAFQMDIKVGGITLLIMKQALLQAKEGRKRILAEMLKCSPPPSKKLAKHAPLIRVIKVEPEKVNLIIGSGGRTVKRIIEQTGVEYIDTQDIGTVKITSRDLASLEKAKAIISNLIMVPVVGNVYRNCKITSVVPYGVFIEIVPGQVGLCHVSELSLDRLSKPSDAFKVGDVVDVKLIQFFGQHSELSQCTLKINGKGQPCLSRKALLLDQGSDKLNNNPHTAGGSNDSCRSGC